MMLNRNGESSHEPTAETLNIAVDFDGTFTANTALFCQLVGQMLKYGADVRIVTFRFSTGNNSDIITWGERLNVPVIFTEGKQKEAFCEALGWEPNIWIDDDPRFIPVV
ncbi:hypothetical protein [Citrobacter portucalensis]|uniref:hypothetical protein n=1 Tax=Citrobacter portucalensis TaxID=1639133 RepID=UPI00211178F5|nr:hypothetical protein [Citrobacter portucalensis]MCQ6312458.1 hypothetical protein [Citrobacter portucalensis]